ncbi:glycosyl hydrolase family 8 [Paucibacter sp. M5-1]|uniref:glycosyl hydrolase family 8 n=1 Tax=Paucibacter sp. M5-1 TaxID=3015998 RepID=UPI0022B92510|nr:glycosyl hydrolase family 8 [Paucibacter sp. M5-1]MCZ7883034.1 glycosyl hydrolase family 8 [Paucibacter sp. M5-1]
MTSRKHFLKQSLAACAGLLSAGFGSAQAQTAPYGLAVSYLPASNSATLTWQSAPPAAFGFDIERRPAGGTTWTKVAYVPEPGRSHTDTNLQPLTRYVYRVIGYRPGGPTAGYTSESMVATPLNFPYGVNYPNGIRPSNFSQAQQNADVLAMWQAWRSFYLTSNGAGTNGIRVYKPAENGESVSEGIGFGMLISVFMAATGNSGKSDLDGLFRYYRSKPQLLNGNGIGLMAWRIAADGSVIDNYVAPDGDIDAAYALLVADKKWGSFGEINYKQEAVAILNNLMKWAVLNRGAGDSNLMYRAAMTVLDRVEKADDYTMSSYQIVSYFKQFKEAAADARWDAVLRAGYKFHDYFYKANPSNGSLTPFTFLTQPGSNQYQPGVKGYNFGYDSSRTPWRLGLDYLWHGTTNANFAKLTHTGINANLPRDMPTRQAKWFEAITGGNPQAAMVSYELGGGTSPGAYRAGQRNMASAMAVGAMTDASNQAWLNTLYAWMRQQVPGQTFSSGGITVQPDYYGDTVLMACMIAVTSNMPDLPAVPIP